jgi:hypothetical protein
MRNQDLATANRSACQIRESAALTSSGMRKRIHMIIRKQKNFSYFFHFFVLDKDKINLRVIYNKVYSTRTCIQENQKPCLIGEKNQRGRDAWCPLGNPSLEY